MLIYQLLITAALAMLLLNTMNNLHLLRTPGAGSLFGVDGPLVSILVPARNEARSISQCVEALACQDYPHCEVLVLDDQSEDETPMIVSELARRYPNVRLLHGQALPSNWHGKAYACAQLAQTASGQWLLFVDADTALAPQCVRIALAQAEERRADLLTMMPRILARSFGEALLLPIIPLTFIAFLPLGLVTNHRSPLFAGALGPFLFFRRNTYLQIGGHAAVRTDIVEDIALSRLVKRHGGRVVWIDGTDLMRVRLYHGFREAWSGLAKSAFAAINYSVPALLLGLPLCIAVFFGPYIFLFALLIGHSASGPVLWLLLLQIILLWISHLLLVRRFHLPPITVFLQAGTILAIVLTTLYSAAQARFGSGVVWKGRTYQFEAMGRSNGLHSGIGRATWSVLVRLIGAALLIVLGMRRDPLHIAQVLVLLGWTLALLERLARKNVDIRWDIWADLASGFACLAYLQLSGQLSAWLALPMLIIIALSTLWFPWQVTAAMASALLGGILLITAEMNMPNKILLGWFVLILLVASRGVAQAVIPWFQRFRSS
jgi:chlorobactene glucosyltransferase